MGRATKTNAKRTVEIDLSQPSARRDLARLYPRPETEVFVDARPEAEKAARAYLEARDEESSARARKERAAAELCFAIGKDLGVRGDGWKATWAEKAGSVDLAALVEDLGVPDEDRERFRRAASRVLDVRELAEGEE